MIQDRTKTLTPLEQTLQRVITSNRFKSGTDTKMSPKDDQYLNLLFKDAMRSNISPFSRFNASMQVEWAFRMLSYLTERNILYPAIPAGIFRLSDDWNEAKPVIERLFRAQWEKACAKEQVEIDAGFGPSCKGVVVENGKVVDPWGFPEALWFLQHMTKYTVFTLWQTVNSAVQECLATDMGAWCLEEKEKDGRTPQDVAATAFDNAMRNLDEHIGEILKGA